jgi:hypothetical protein
LRTIVDPAKVARRCYVSPEDGLQIRRLSMKYLLMIYSDQAQDAARSKQELDQEMNEYWAYDEAAAKAGVKQGGEALHPTTSATTVRVRDGKTLATDGPFAETKEQLGGYYLLDCKNLDEAIQWAAKIPTARSGSIEIRPVVDFSQVTSAGNA